MTLLSQGHGSSENLTFNGFLRRHGWDVVVNHIPAIPINHGIAWNSLDPKTNLTIEYLLEVVKKYFENMVANIGDLKNM